LAPLRLAGEEELQRAHVFRPYREERFVAVLECLADLAVDTERIEIVGRLVRAAPALARALPRPVPRGIR
jgi:hypothetical protein